MKTTAVSFRDGVVRGAGDVAERRCTALARELRMPIRRFVQRLAIEHDRLDDSLGDLGRFLRADDQPAALAQLRSVFLVHHAKEEWVIHPLLSAAVAPTTEDAVVRWLIEP